MTATYMLNTNFDRKELRNLLHKFRANCRRSGDETLAKLIEAELLESDPPRPRFLTYKRLAKWCSTGGNPYQDAVPVAREISRLLFGCVLDRDQLGV
ncbi:MAG: hypothetical protein ACRD5F_01595 [Candidatus Acidiferrales bacterium]